ncbi:ribonuclease BN (tRNA processing enzyme) [Caldalkalibacillus uzonensis]|uniref:Ribonuclease BN (tRNA processing enzyme) n=1 Tax=Caldalkalibacillus uzonensis TaxID=353224 RepID=A0ABU0CWL2_9BACI|nr:MBL fold metallo-hydrolase [Caldalkalibacillus uzonensis]MDQ0340807.1 ribonuclease BN (tRNA processing enzyme) [Caldalkalibacillus uzonensis]
MDFEVQFLGSGDAFSSGGKMHTCILVKTATRQFLIDCGASAMIGIKKYNVNPNDIDLILITHLHGDHFGGIPFFVLDAQLIHKRSKPLTIAGPPGIKKRIFQAMEVMFPGSSRIQQKFKIEIIEFEIEKTNVFSDVTVLPYLVKHPSGDPSLALKIQHLDKIIAYTGDTEWVDNLIPLSKNADLLIAECYFFDKKVKYHLDYQTLFSHLNEIEPKKLVLTHMSDDMLKRVGELESDFAEDGKIFKI